MFSDEEIVARVRAGEHVLFGLLIRRHEGRVHRTARAILHDENEAQDVTQDAFVRAYEHLGAFEGRAQFSTWLTRIAVREAFARRRRRDRFESLDARTEDSTMATTTDPTPEQQAGDVELRTALETAVDTLSPDFRAVFMLRAIDGMSGAEVAGRLGIGEETVRTRLFRARVQLQHVLRAQRV